MFIQESVYDFDDLYPAIQSGEWWLVCLRRELGDGEWLFWGKGKDPLANLVSPLNSGKTFRLPYESCLEEIKRQIDLFDYRFSRNILVVISRLSPGGYSISEAFVGGIPKKLRQKGLLEDAELLCAVKSERRSLRTGGAATQFEKQMRHEKGTIDSPEDVSSLSQELINRGLGVWIYQYNVLCKDEKRRELVWAESAPTTCSRCPEHTIEVREIKKTFVSFPSSSIRDGEELIVGSLEAVDVKRSSVSLSKRKQEKVKNSLRGNAVLQLQENRKKTSEW